jgi:hypothetical protein
LTVSHATGPCRSTMSSLFIRPSLQRLAVKSTHKLCNRHQAAPSPRENPEREETELGALLITHDQNAP